MKSVYIVVLSIAVLALGGYVAFWIKSEPQRDDRRRAQWIEDTFRLAQYETRNGEQEAVRDIQSGKILLKRGGCEFDPAILEYRAILSERYGVGEDPMPGPFTSEAAMRYEASYNKVVWSHLFERFGVTSDKVWEEAHARFKEKKKAANQALQTTSVTRSGFGKVPVSDRHRRGV